MLDSRSVNRVERNCLQETGKRQMEASVDTELILRKPFWPNLKRCGKFL